jgi:hypothetical protein
LFGALSTSFAAGQINYEEFFAEALKTDGAASEHYKGEVGVLFDSDPEGFIRALYQAPSEQVHTITIWLAASHYADLTGFRRSWGIKPLRRKFLSSTRF